MADEEELYSFNLGDTKRIADSTRYVETVRKNTIPAQRARALTPSFQVYARCLQFLHRGVTSCQGQIIIRDLDGTYTDGDQAPVTLVPDFINGYFPAGARVEIRPTGDDTQMTVHGTGVFELSGQLKGDIAMGTTAQLTIEKTKQRSEWSDKSITVVGKWGSARANETIGCTWNDGLLQWEASLAQCAVVLYPSSPSGS